MLKVIALVCAFVIGVSGDAQFLGLGGITLNSVAVTSTSLETSSNWAVVIFQRPTTYVGDGSVNFQLSFNVTYSGVTQSDPRGVLSFSGPGDLFDELASCQSQRTVFMAGTQITNGLYYFNYAGGLRFTATGTYTATLGISSLLEDFVATGTFSFSVTTAYTIPSGDRPQLASFSLVPQQTAQPPQINLTLSSFTGTNLVTVYFQPSSPQGVTWSTSCQATNGVCSSNDWSILTPIVGGYCDDYFSLTTYVTGTAFQKDTPVQVRSITVSSVGFPRNFFGPPSGNIQLSLSTGSDDHTPPTCTTATFGSTTVSTGDSSSYIPVTTDCSDAGGAIGLVGGIFRLTTDSGVTLDREYDSGGSSSVSFLAFPPLHYSGTYSIIGLFAVDTAGNAVLYGSCGSSDIASELTTLCGGGGSGSSTGVSVVASLGLVWLCSIIMLLML